MRSLYLRVFGFSKKKKNLRPFFRVRQKRASSCVIIASHGGRFLGFSSNFRKQSGCNSLPKNELTGRTHIVRTHPRYPRHFRSTEKKKKNYRVVASTLSPKRILTSAVSFSLFPSATTFAIRDSETFIEALYFRHDIPHSFTFFASMIFLGNILDLMTPSSHNRI